MLVTSLDIRIPFSKRHPNETIRVIARYVSGYLKDLLVKDESFVFSLECYQELKALTLGHKDNWVKPDIATKSIFDSLKPYRVPYLFDFNNSEIEELNTLKLKNL